MVMLCWLLKKHIIPLFILFELITKMLTQRQYILIYVVIL
jgi:hypothetical protein